MPINIPTITQLRDRIKEDIETRLNITIPTISKNFLYTWVGVQASVIKLMYNLIHFVSQNITPDTAVSESIGGTLERWGRLKLNRNPFNAKAGIYNISVTGTIGSVINVGQIWRSKETATSSNKLFIVDSQITLSTSPQNIEVRALEPSLSSLLSVNDELIYVSPIVGINQLATVTSVVVNPLNAETLEEYRGKVITAFRLEPQGGASGDYILWSADAQGVRRLFPYAKSGESSCVNVFVEAVETSNTLNGVPTLSMLENVEEVIEQDPDITKPIYERSRRPLGALNVYVLPIIPIPIQINILGAIGFSNSIKASILASVKNYLLTVRPFIAGADTLNEKNDILSVNNLIFEIQNVIPKDTRFATLTMNVSGVSQSSFTFINGDIPYLDTIVYV